MLALFADIAVVCTAYSVYIATTSALATTTSPVSKAVSASYAASIAA